MGEAQPRVETMRPAQALQRLLPNSLLASQAGVSASILMRWPNWRLALKVFSMAGRDLAQVPTLVRSLMRQPQTDLTCSATGSLEEWARGFEFDRVRRGRGWDCAFIGRGFSSLSVSARGNPDRAVACLAQEIRVEQSMVAVLPESKLIIGVNHYYEKHL